MCFPMLLFLYAPKYVCIKLKKKKNPPPQNNPQLNECKNYWVIKYIVPQKLIIQIFLKICGNKISCQKKSKDNSIVRGAEEDSKVKPSKPY